MKFYFLYNCFLSILAVPSNCVFENNDKNGTPDELIQCYLMKRENKYVHPKAVIARKFEPTIYPTYDEMFRDKCYKSYKAWPWLHHIPLSMESVQFRDVRISSGHAGPFLSIFSSLKQNVIYRGSSSYFIRLVQRMRTAQTLVTSETKFKI